MTQHLLANIVLTALRVQGWSSVCGRVCLFVWLGIAWPMSARLRAQPYDDAPATLRVMTWNVEWMYDHYLGDNKSRVSREQSAPSEAYWQAKLGGVAEVLGKTRPDIVALQEIEGVQTLAAIKDRVKEATGISYRYAFIQGTDSFLEQDVGILMRSGLVAYRRQEQSRTMFLSNEYYNLSKHLIAEFRWGNVQRPLTLMTVHLRATAAAEDKRVRQAKLARLWMETPLKAGHDVLLVGDFNSEHAVGVNEGVVAVIGGGPDQEPFLDLLANHSDPQAPTHAVLDRQFDRIFASDSLLRDEPGLDWSFAAIEILDDVIVQGEVDGPKHESQRLTLAPAEVDLSDHFPVMATFKLR